MCKNAALVLSIVLSFPAARADAQTCAAYPYTLSNGAVADANQVMANFNCAALLGGANFTGNVSTSGLLTVSNYGLTYHNWGSVWRPVSDNLTYPLVFFNAAGGQVGSIQTSSTSTSYWTTSDRRLKENISLSARGLSDLMLVHVDEYNFIGQPRSSRVQGLIAQELQKIYPEAVVVGEADPAEQPWGIDYGRLVPLLIKAIQDQQAEIVALKADIAALQERPK